MLILTASSYVGGGVGGGGTSTSAGAFTTRGKLIDEPGNRDGNLLRCAILGLTTLS